MSDLFIGSNYRPNRPEAVNFKPVGRPDVNQVPNKVIEKGDEFCKGREKTREKLFQEKDRGEKGCFEKGKEKITCEKDRTEKNREKVTREKDFNEKRVEKCFEKPGEKKNEKITQEKDFTEKRIEKRDEKQNEKLGEKGIREKDAEKAIWPPEHKGCRTEKDAEKHSLEKRCEKHDEKMSVEKRTEKHDLEKLNVEKRTEKCFGEKHIEILPYGGSSGSESLPSDRFFYKG